MTGARELLAQQHMQINRCVRMVLRSLDDVPPWLQKTPAKAWRAALVEALEKAQTLNVAALRALTPPPEPKPYPSDVEDDD